MMYDTFLFKGHGLAASTNSYDPGATYNGYKEAEITNKIVDQALIYLKPLNLNIHVSENNFIDKDTMHNTYKYKSGLSVHINAGGGSGTEIYVPLNEKYLLPDEILCRSISSLLNIPNRGVKSRDYNTGNFITRVSGTKITGTDYYGEIRTAWKDGISLSLLEVGFIDTSDINKILDNIDNIAYCIAVYIASICSVELSESKTYSITINDLKIEDEALKLHKELQCRGYNVTLK